MKKITVSHGEIEIMKTLWQAQKPLLTVEITDMVQKNNDWSKNTIATMLDRLVKKGAVSRCGNRRSYLFAPLLDEEECKMAAITKLTGQFFNGSLCSMLNFFAAEKQFTADDICEIKIMIEKMEEEK